MYLKLIPTVAAAALLSACASTDPYTGSTTGSLIAIQYVLSKRCNRFK